MQYVSSKNLDYRNTFFHFTRIDSRESIEQNGLQAVAGGENEAGNDKNNKTIYFVKGIKGVLEAVDVWARWEYDKYVSTADHKINYGYQGYDKKVMKDIIYDKLYKDFKERQYYAVDFEEGKNGDFEYGDIDLKKILSRDKDGNPYIGALWKYGPFSDFGTLEKPNNKQEEWNMNTKIGERTIFSDRLKIVETEEGKSDALSVILEAYNKYRPMVSEENNKVFEILDGFASYAKERYKEDKDYTKGSSDLGRRDVDKARQDEYKQINNIKEEI